MPSRHLGLVPAIERGDLDSYFDELATAIEATVDLDQLLAITKAPEIQVTTSIFEKNESRLRQ